MLARRASAGSVLSAFTCTPATSTVKYVLNGDISCAGPCIEFGSNQQFPNGGSPPCNNATRYLELSFLAPLADGGGTVKLYVSNVYNNSSHECLNCLPLRIFTGESVSAALTVSPSADLSVTPTMLTFQIQPDSPVQSQLLQIGGTAGTQWQVTTTTSSGGSWLSVSGNDGTQAFEAVGGQIPASITVLVNPSGPVPGIYQATITVKAAAAAPSSSMITVTAIVNSTASPPPSVSFMQYSIPTLNAGIVGMVKGPDAALWFTEATGNKIGRITTSGTITEYAIPTAASSPAGITLGPDGALWFTESQADKIGRITTSGVITECAIPTPASGTCHIAAGADGALWFTESGPNQIGRITVSGAFKEFPHSGDRPGSISVGPDGALWFTEFNSQQAAEARIGRITTSGVITEYAAFAGQNGVTVQVVEAVFSNDGAGWALRCDRMAALR